jgi:hypothetical protein
LAGDEGDPLCRPWELEGIIVGGDVDGVLEEGADFAIPLVRFDFSFDDNASFNGDGLPCSAIRGIDRLVSVALEVIGEVVTGLLCCSKEESFGGIGGWDSGFLRMSS